MIIEDYIQGINTTIYGQDIPKTYSKQDLETINNEVIRTEIVEITHIQFAYGKFGFDPANNRAQLQINAKNNLVNDTYIFHDKHTIDELIKELHIEKPTDFETALGRKIQRYSGSIGIIGFSLIE